MPKDRCAIRIVCRTWLRFQLSCYDWLEGNLRDRIEVEQCEAAGVEDRFASSAKSGWRYVTYRYIARARYRAIELAGCVGCWLGCFFASTSNANRQSPNANVALSTPSARNVKYVQYVQYVHYVQCSVLCSPASDAAPFASVRLVLLLALSRLAALGRLDSSLFLLLLHLLLLLLPPLLRPHKLERSAAGDVQDLQGCS